uniref:Ig-like domain-containing protein n=1 Tax=Seriola lalandi dorsalis TaxID=1841481 RepID=A0A3B4X0P7_SERLL
MRNLSFTAVNILINTCFYLPGPDIIKVKEGSDVTLPCNIAGNIESKRFVWKKDGQKEVYVYDAGLSSSQGLSGQSDQFKGRVSHFPGELKNGDASIKIRNTKVADSGDYTCEFQHLPNQRFLMKLLVGECFHYTADYLQMRLSEYTSGRTLSPQRCSHIWTDSLCIKRSVSVTRRLCRRAQSTFSVHAQTSSLQTLTVTASMC